MNELKLETGTLRVTRNAELLSAITYGGIALASLSEPNLILPLSIIATIGSLDAVLNCQKDFELLDENSNKNNIHKLRNETSKLNDETLKYNKFLNFGSSIFNASLSINMLAYNLNIDSNIFRAGIIITGLISSAYYAKSASMYAKLINKVNDEKLEREKIKRLSQI